MREIKCRGINFETGKWEFGSLVKCNSSQLNNGSPSNCYIFGDFSIDDVHSILNNGRRCVKTCNVTHVIQESVGQFTGELSLGADIYEGDIVEYWDLYECHSDAVDYFDVEPQNNFSVSEVYPEIKKGVVEFINGSFSVNSHQLSELRELVGNKILNCFHYVDLGMSYKDFVYMCIDFGLKSPIRGKKHIKIIGNIHENPDLLK